MPFIAQPIGKIGKQAPAGRHFHAGADRPDGEPRRREPRGNPVAKTYGLEGYLKGRAAYTFDEVRKLKMKAANARGRLDPLLEAGGGFAVAAVLVLIGQRIASGGSRSGDFTGFVAP